MLHWLAGQRQPERDEAESDEPPETPAPVFAVRAFKHAIFGTPSTALPPRQRRDSNPGKDQARATSRPSRPLLVRPKSANDAVTCARTGDFPPSPTKGILLTPGTIGGRGKTVTFGDPKAHRDDARGTNKIADDSKKRIDPFEALAELDSSVNRSPDRAARKQNAAQESCCDSRDVAGDVDDHPTCTVAQYWKQEYDIYRENTSRELRKLITKQKAAKSYAREKDEQCIALSEELQQERKKVERLEKLAKELEMKLKEQQARFESNMDVVVSTTEPARPKVDLCSRPTRTTTADDIDDETVASHDTGLATLTQPKHNEQQVVLGPSHSEAEVSRRPPRLRHDSLDPDTYGASQLSTIARKSRTIPDSHLEDLPRTYSQESRSKEDKENSILVTQTPSMSQGILVEAPKGIVSRDGEIIPPDRVAAARARLAARRQQRIVT